MTRRFRRFIFLIFTGFFVVSSFTIILFAEGYRFDFDSFRIVKTGGIFIKTSTNDAKIYIDDKYVESTGGILTHSVLIDGLTPKNYNVFVYKENYYPWNKVVNVKSGMVTELDGILLFSLELQKSKVAELPVKTISEFIVNGDDNTVEVRNNKTKTLGIYNLVSGKLLSSGPASGWKNATSSADSVSPDKNKRLYVSNNQVWVEYLNDVTKEPVEKAGEKELIAVYDSPINFFDWFDDSKHLIWYADKELTVAELDNRGGKRNSIKFYPDIDPPVFWDRANSELYFFEKTTGKNILYKISFKS